MKKLFTLLLLVFTISNFAQIKGKITDHNGNPISFATVLVDNKIAASDEHGEYFLDFKTLGVHTLIFRCLGYKTHTVTLTIDKLPFLHDVKLASENVNLK